MDLMLVKVKYISDGGSVSAITYLRRGKNTLSNSNCSQREEWENERSNSANIKISEGKGGGALEARAGIPLQPMEHGGGADICLQACEETHAGAGRCAWRRLSPHKKLMLKQAPGSILAGPVERGVHFGAGFLAVLVTLWGTYSGTVCSWSTSPCGRNPHWSSSWRTATRGKDFHWRSSWKIVSRKRPHAAGGKSVISLPPALLEVRR